MLPMLDRSPALALVIRAMGERSCIPEAPLGMSNRTMDPSLGIAPPSGVIVAASGIAPPSGIVAPAGGRLATHREPLASNARFPGLLRAGLRITRAGSTGVNFIGITARGS